MGNKKYQVFISSTFRDLIEERQAVLMGVLELSHIPVGMELFPAANESAWQLIKKVIDTSDYYILIIGGRYGSVDEEGIGYTEKEYDYAVSSNKPVIPILHRNPDNLPRGKIETDENIWVKLQKFRKKVEDKHGCVYWENKDELKNKVFQGLISSIEQDPGVGWIRADKIREIPSTGPNRSEVKLLEYIVTFASLNGKYNSLSVQLKDNKDEKCLIDIKILISDLEKSVRKIESIEDLNLSLVWRIYKNEYIAYGYIMLSELDDNGNKKKYAIRSLNYVYKTESLIHSLSDITGQPEFFESNEYISENWVKDKMLHTKAIAFSILCLEKISIVDLEENNEASRIVINKELVKNTWYSISVNYRNNIKTEKEIVAILNDT